MAPEASQDANTTAGENGVAAVRKKEYNEAVRLLDIALEDSSSPTWLLARAQAHQHLGHNDEALRDAELAYVSAVERGTGATRKHLIDAQYRRAVILFAMGRYADADCCARWSQRLAESRPATEDDGIRDEVDADGFYTATLADVRAQVKTQSPNKPHDESAPAVRAWNRAWMWRSQTLERMGKLPAGDPGRKVTVTKVPSPSKLGQVVPPEASKPKEPEPIPAPPQKPMQGQVSSSDKLPKLRSDFYQTSASVTITLFAKGVDPSKLEVHFTETEVSLAPITGELAASLLPESHLMLRLGGHIVPEGCRYSVTPSKIELVVQKKVPGVRWATWGSQIELADRSSPPSRDLPPSDVREEEPPVVELDSAGGAAPGPGGESMPKRISRTVPQTLDAPAEGGAAGQTANAPTSRPPAYPTSSKSGPKNWDKLDDSDEEDDSKHDVDHFFKKLYGTATDDQRRAMMKSFLESNGTTLSTDWNDVGSRTVTTVPPDGVEAKKW